MTILNLKQKTTNKNPLLSATRPVNKFETVHTQTRTKQVIEQSLKQKIIIYVAPDKLYIDHATAYALNLVSTRTIMVSDSPKLVELPETLHNKLKSDSNIEIEYVNTNIKQKMKLFTDGKEYAIECGTAYALGLMSVSEFNDEKSRFYYISSEYVDELKNKYDIEVFPLTDTIEKDAPSNTR